MAVLQCVKPGAKRGQILLSVDLTNAGDTDIVLNQLSDMGYSPSIRHVSYASGVHVHALLKDEQYSGDETHLMDEWQSLAEKLGGDVVHLWKGK